MHLYIPPGLVECLSASGYSGKDLILGLKDMRSGSVLNGISRMIKRTMFGVGCLCLWTVECCGTHECYAFSTISIRTSTKFPVTTIYGEKIILSKTYPVSMLKI